MVVDIERACYIQVVENYENEDNDIDLKTLLEKLADTEIGQKVEKALYRLKMAMEKVSGDEDITELGKRCYADLSQARIGLGEDGGLLDPFFAMFHGIFTSLDESELDPSYEYEEDEEALEPEFTVMAVIPLTDDENPLGAIRNQFIEDYPQYTIIDSKAALMEENDDEDHFFVQSPAGTLVSIAYIEEEGKIDSLEPFITNTDTEIDDYVQEALDGDIRNFLEIYLAPETGITTSEKLSEDGLSNQMEKAEMAARLASTALESEDALCIFTNGRLYGKDEYSELVSDLDNADFMPADLFAYTYMENLEDDETAIMTMGLSNYGFLELIAITGNEELEREEMFCAVQDLVNYILQRGIAISDGDVLSYDGHARYQFRFEDLDGQPVYRVRRLVTDDDVDIYSLNSEFHGPISWNRYDGITCPLSLFWNDRKTVLLFHVPGTEASYSGFMNEYTYLLDNLTFIFEGIKDYFSGEDALRNRSVRGYMKRNGVKGDEMKSKLLSLKPTDIFLSPTVDSIREGATMMVVRYRERKNSRSYIEVGIDSDVQLSGITAF